VSHGPVWHPFTQHALQPEAIEIARAEGAWLERTDGTRILDAISSWWVITHGHRHPRIIAAMKAQADQLGVPVGAQVPGHHDGPGQAVLGGPGLRLQAQDQELGRPCPQVHLPQLQLRPRTQAGLGQGQPGPDRIGAAPEAEEDCGHGQLQPPVRGGMAAPMCRVPRRWAKAICCWRSLKRARSASLTRSMQCGQLTPSR
jgi:hypothetical protein